MDFKQFLEDVKEAVQVNLGIGYDIDVQKITKNNGVILDGLIISNKDKQFAPTIYLNSYYMHFEQGMPLLDIIKDIIDVYKENMSITLGDMKMLLDFNNLKDKVAYKLIQKATNEALLEDIPSCEFLDLAVVFYLILDENREGQMTALINNSHMRLWGTTKGELYRLAKENTPKLLPPVIRTMEEVMREIMKGHVKEQLGEELLDDLFASETQKKTLYMLSNQNQVNGAGCILYDRCLETFASKYDSDIVILPSSIHEVLLIPDRELDYDELLEMVIEINRTEVPQEDVLSDNLYKYERRKKQITMLDRFMKRS